ncbi:hypothetical protein EI555_016544, partial [Monodon monoceros]
DYHLLERRRTRTRTLYERPRAGMLFPVTGPWAAGENGERASTPTARGAQTESQDGGDGTLRYPHSRLARLVSAAPSRPRRPATTLPIPAAMQPVPVAAVVRLPCLSPPSPRAAAPQPAQQATRAPDAAARDWQRPRTGPNPPGSARRRPTPAGRRTRLP